MKVVSILSGGLDSTVLLYDLVNDSLVEEVKALTFFYGQRHDREVFAARRVCAAIGVGHEVVDITNVHALFGANALTNYSVDVPEGHYADESMKTTVVPNRNMIFISLATAYAISLGYDAVAIGVHSGDHAVYPDCRPAFHGAMWSALQLCHYTPVELLRPFLAHDKSSIVLMGAQLDVPFELTYSCYAGGAKHCGVCGTCVERKEAFVLADIGDLTEYEE